MTENICFMDRVESLLKEKRLTQKELAEDLELRRPTLSDWKKNGAVPAGDICIRIADYLGVSVEWLVTGKEAALSSEERTLLKQWQVLSEEQKDTIRTLLDKWVSEHQAREKKASDA